MADATPSSSQPGAMKRKPPVIPSGVLAMLVFVAIEMMMFSGLISAYIIVKGGAAGGVWPPPGQPRLPVEETAFNTAALLFSGATLFWAEHSFRKAVSSAKFPLLLTVLLGTFFIGFQGREWVALLSQGLTLQSSTYGGFFYLIVGMHGIHAIAALGGLVWCWVQLLRGKLGATAFWSVQVFWYFVVGLWPLLYWLVYL